MATEPETYLLVSSLTEVRELFGPLHSRASMLIMTGLPGIEHPVYNDYYLQSQAGLKGSESDYLSISRRS